MRMSVAVVTARPGGLDVLFTGLKYQTFQDFEVILVDALYHRRAALVADYAASAGLVVRHMPPKDLQFPVDSVPAARNTAIAKARGELLLWLVDYSWIPADGLESHWAIWEGFSKKTAGGMGAHRYLCPPKPAYTLPSYAPCVQFAGGSGTPGVTYEYDVGSALLYATDLAGGFYDSWMYSVFADPIRDPSDIAVLSEDHLFKNADPKLAWGEGLVGACDGFHAKNESVPVSWMLAVNGFDEEYTGHLYDDTDFGYRIKHMNGKWVTIGPQVLLVNPRHLFPHLVRRDPTEAQRAKFEKLKVSPEMVRANSYNLAGMREMGRWWDY